MDTVGRERVVETLVEGRDWTRALQILIRRPSSDDDVSMSQQKKELVEKILRSLTETLSLISGSPCEYSGEVSQIPASVPVGTPSSVHPRSVDSGQSSKKPASRDRRGGYKRRKSSDSWIKVSPSTVDEYAWRKYGQKEILNSEFPRCYFRCTHKNDQDCKAIKQVQQIQAEPRMYQTTYFGYHTCRTAMPSRPQINVVESPSEGYSHIINFESNTPVSEVYPDELLPFDSTAWPDLPSLLRPDTNEDFPSSVFSCDDDMDLWCRV